MTNQGLLQQSIRNITGTEYDYNGDWHALFDLYSIPQGTFNERLIAFLQGQLGTAEANLDNLKNAYCLQIGVYNWNCLTSLILIPLNNLEAWYDSSDASTITESGGSVSQIDDKSGNNNHATQSTGSLQPTFGTDASGNFLQFVGSGLGASTNYLDITSAVNSKTVFFVCDHDGTTFSGVLGFDSASSSHIFLEQSSYAISLDGAVSDVGNWYLDGTFQATGGNVGDPTIIGNGTRLHTVKFNSGDPATGFNLIGAAFDTKTLGFGGKIREIIIYDEYLSNTDRESVETYLINKWNL